MGDRSTFGSNLKYPSSFIAVCGVSLVTFWLDVTSTVKTFLVNVYLRFIIEMHSVVQISKMFDFHIFFINYQCF